EPVVAGDVGPDTDWRHGLEGIDIVVHTASMVHIMKDTASGSEFMRVNAEGTGRLAQHALKAGVSRFVYISSIKVNGDGKGNPYNEKDEPLPRDSYGLSKLEAEKRLWAISEGKSMETVVLRPPLVYGPGVRANFLRLIGLVDKGVPLPFASLKNQRSIIYLGNLTHAIALCSFHRKAPGETYLVSDCEDVSTPGLIRMIAKELGRTTRLLPFPEPLFRAAAALFGMKESLGRLIGSLEVDCSKIQRELGWSPPYSVEQGIHDTIEWYVKRRKD
ncbi:MAG: NAD-dependent epimerase/dehydratase family protein, partial [Deltaproteobacteria bacterium]|nr:NAD-dependent epimerase/dehydratase family protein [Deltaproteobacteria bacterium]